ANHDLVVHSRQCVGRTSVHLLLSALIHPPKTRRRGKAITCTPVSSITASSRSRSNGAVNTGCHIMPIKTLDAPTVCRWAVVKMGSGRYRGLSAELKFGNSRNEVVVWLSHNSHRARRAQSFLRS